MALLRFNPCPVCGGPSFTLGHLGNVLWFRCRDCGADFSANETFENWEDLHAEEEVEDSIGCD